MSYTNPLHQNRPVTISCNRDAFACLFIHKPTETLVQFLMG